MDYKEEYQNALERAKRIYEVINDVGKKDLEAIFPELRESEDERIRKFLVELVSNDMANNYVGLYQDRGVRFDDVLAYLERMKEQETAEWREEDKKMLNGIIERGNSEIPKGECGLTPNQVAWLETRFKSLRPMPKREREPMKIKYHGKIYPVRSVMATPGGIPGYIIEDELGFCTCITNPEEVL